jgi:hypothetical protein
MNVAFLQRGERDVSGNRTGGVTKRLLTCLGCSAFTG